MGSLDCRVAVERVWKIRDGFTRRHAEDADMVELCTPHIIQVAVA